MCFATDAQAANPKALDERQRREMEEQARLEAENEVRVMEQQQIEIAQRVAAAEVRRLRHIEEDK